MRTKIKRKILPLLLTFLFALQLCACGGSSYDAYDSLESSAIADNTTSGGGLNFGYNSSFTDSKGSMDMEESKIEEPMVEESVEIEENQEEIQINQRKLIKNVSMTVETNTFEEFIEELNNEVVSMGGYIEESNLYGFSMYSDRDGTREAYYKIRIPQNKVDTFVSFLDGDTNVLEKRENIKDITLEYVDIESRKNSLLTEEQRLIELLENAQDLTDVIQIEDKLSEVRYEIDRMESSLRTFDSLVSYSTIDLDVREVKDYTTIKTIEITPWEEMKQGFADSIDNIKEGLIDFVILVFTNLPYIILLGIFALAIFIIIKIIIFFNKKSEKKNKEKVKHEQKNVLQNVNMKQSIQQTQPNSQITTQNPNINPKKENK